MSDMLADASKAASKQILRAAALARRDALDPHLRQHAAETLAARGLPFALRSGTIVSGFAPMRSEINPIPLMHKLADQGAHLALPVVIGRGKPLLFRAWAFHQPLAAGTWGIREPKADAPEVGPDVVLVPLAAFDRAGHRLGYGARYYDLTLEALRAKKKIVAIGVAYASQEIDLVPTEPHDQALDYVLTEAGVAVDNAGRA
ncbi:MAG TPA: 5-formyltetrahydrofolate cyclo-ligase [Xanthobacteraceae bacterium]|nr:5-formyltetrahydrofolate cyclo-ligase [Xanthobacteraceae bacterium]